MAERTKPESPGVTPYASLEEMNEEHSTLNRRRRTGFVDNPVDLKGEIAVFLQRGGATGAFLSGDNERYSAQSLLSYWSNVLYRLDKDVEVSDVLAPFDPKRSSDLTGVDNPYLTLSRPAEEDLTRS